MRIGMLRALVVSAAVLTLGMLSIRQVKGATGTTGTHDPLPASDSDPDRAYQKAYADSYEKAKANQVNANATQPQDGGGSSGGSCG
jgi:hypothetical protein